MSQYTLQQIVNFSTIVFCREIKNNILSYKNKYFLVDSKLYKIINFNYKLLPLFKHGCDKINNPVLGRKSWW